MTDTTQINDTLPVGVMTSRCKEMQRLYGIMYARAARRLAENNATTREEYQSVLDEIRTHYRHCPTCRAWLDQVKP